MKAAYFSAAAMAALPSLGAASLSALVTESSAAAPRITGFSTTTSTQTVLHVITETYFSSTRLVTTTELEKSTELVPITSTPTPIHTPVPIATPISSFPTLAVTANSTQGINSTMIKATKGATGTAINIATAGTASATPTATPTATASTSSSPAPTGAATAIQISGAAIAAIVAAAGFFML